MNNNYEKKLGPNSLAFFNKMVKENEGISYYTTFEKFIAEEIIENYYNAELNTDEILVGNSNDGGIDIINYDENTETLTISQVKLWDSFSKNDLDETFSKLIKAVDQINKDMIYNFNKMLLSKLTEIKNQIENQKISLVLNVIVASSNNLSDQVVKESENYFRKQVSNILKNNNGILRVTDFELNYINSEKIENLFDEKYAKNGIEKGRLKIKDKESFIKMISDEEKEITIAAITGESLRNLYLNSLNNSKASLFEKNVRGYVKDKKIDDAIVNTLKNDPNEFSMLNNGITIVCDKCEIDSVDVKMENMYIINGGQTTTLIGKCDNSINLKNVIIFCKIITFKNDEDIRSEKIEKITIASNQQKPIKPEDIISQNAELLRFDKKVNNNLRINAYFMSKRNVNKEIYFKKLIKNNGSKLFLFKSKEILQLFKSFFDQEPHIARNNPSKFINGQNNYVSKVFNSLLPNSENGVHFLNDLFLIFSKLESNKKHWVKKMKGKNLNNEIDSLFEDNKIDTIQVNSFYYWIAGFGFIYAVNSFLKNDKNFKEILHNELLENRKKIDLSNNSKIYEYLINNQRKILSDFKGFIRIENENLDKEITDLTTIWAEEIKNKFNDEEDWSKLLKKEDPICVVRLSIIESLVTKKTESWKLINSIFNL
ncbi:AIPR family protein [Mesoplasma florum]|uniref:AIPR family protein n=1 Tax=Mesoplasma florum TaxID=2151 RepID=UPI000BE35DF2|nr:AIPR family protein [Mesoplasma florum]ATI73278.1 hypothetical protein CQZ69_01715 [Mesoplasma florum]AVN61680.1 hypothetical protein CG004_01715 [Mesoplasma florum]